MPAPISPNSQQVVSGNNNGGFLDRLSGGGQQVAFVDTGIQSFVDGGISSSGGFTTSDKSAYTSYDDPTYLGFKMVFDFSTSPLLAGTLLSADNQSNQTTTVDASALSYLKKVAPSKADYLIKFANTLNDIQSKRHYFFQEVEGLDQIWKTSTNFMKGDPYRGGEDSKILINCLESVDLKTSAIMALYRNALLDLKMRRIILPKNLRYFNVTIYIQEIRNFKEVIRRLSMTGSNSLPSAASFVNDNISTISFKLKKCEWIPEDSADFLTGVSNVSNEVIKNKLGFHYSDVSEAYEFMGLSTEIDGDKNVSSNIPQFINTVAERVQQNAQNQAAKQVGKLLSDANVGPVTIPNPFSMGNAFGINSQAINNLTAEGIIAGVSNLGGDVLSLGDVFEGQDGDSPDPLTPTKAFEIPAFPSSEIGEENIYSGEATPSVGGINGGNSVYEGVIPPNTGGDPQGSVDRSGGQSGDPLPGDENVYGSNIPSGPPLNPYNVFE